MGALEACCGQLGKSGHLSLPHNTQAMMQGCGEAFTPRIAPRLFSVLADWIERFVFQDEAMLDLMQECSRKGWVGLNRDFNRWIETSLSISDFFDHPVEGVLSFHGEAHQSLCEGIHLLCAEECLRRRASQLSKNTWGILPVPCSSGVRSRRLYGFGGTQDGGWLKTVKQTGRQFSFLHE